MKYFQPLLLFLMAVFTQCTSSAPAKRLPELFKSDPTVIKNNHIRLSRYYEVKYDESGRELKRRLVKTSYYDSTGRAYLVVRPDYAIDTYLSGRDVSDSLTGRSDSIFYSYDASGRITEILSHYNFNNRASVEVVTYKFDSLGNQVAKIDMREGLDTVILYTNYVYGKNGRILHSEDRQVGGASGEKKLKRVEYAYDNKGNIIKMGDVSYKYKGAGLLAESEQVMGDFKLRTKYVYNDAGKCTGLASVIFDAEKKVWDSAGRGEYTYDERNLLLTGLDMDKESGKRTAMFIYEYE